MSIIFTGTGTGDTGLSVSSGNFRKELEMKDMNPVEITIPLDQPDYYGRSQIHEITIGTTGEMYMFLVRNETENQEILYSDGWFNEEKDQTRSWRWMTNHSTLFVYSDTEQNKTIQFDGLSFGSPRNLALHGDGYYQVNRFNPENYTSITSSIPLKAGYTAIQFDVPDGCTRPSDVTGLNNRDTRCLSINVRDIKIS
jgi:hypothetical protein